MNFAKLNPALTDLLEGFLRVVTSMWMEVILPD